MENKPDALTKTPDHTPVPGVSETIDAQVVELKKLSDALEKRAQNTIDKLEKVKYQKLIDELSKSWDAQSEKVSTGTRDLQAELRARITPDQQKLLDETKQGFMNGFGLGNSEVAAGAKDLMKKTVAWGEKAVEAIKTGDYSQAKKIAKDISETTNAAGEKVLAYAGTTGLVKLLEPIKKGFVDIGALLSRLWNFFTGDFTFSDVIGTAGEGQKDAVIKSVDDAKDKAANVLNTRRDKIWSTLLKANTSMVTFVDPKKTKEFNAAWDQYVAEAKSPNGDGGEMLDESTGINFRTIFNSEKQSAKNFMKNLRDNKVYLIETDIEYNEAVKKIWNQIVASGWISPEDAKQKEEKFYEMMKDKKYQTLLDPLKAVKNDANWNLADAVGNAWAVGSSFIFDLQRAGIIPLSAIGAYFVDGALSVGLASTKFLLNHSVDQFVYTVSWKSLEDINKMEPENKKVLMAILYHNMSLQLYMTGLATKLLATAGLMGLYWEQGTGLTSMKWQLENALGEYDKVGKTLEHLAADTLPANESAQLKGFDQTVRQFIAEKSVQFKLVDIYRQNPKATPQELTQLMEKGVQIDAVKNPQVATQQKRYLSEVLETLKKETTEEGFKARLTNIIKTPPQSNLIAGEWTSRFWSAKAFFTGADQQSTAHFELERANAQMSEAMARWVTERWTVGDWMLKVGRALGYGSPADFIKAFDKWQNVINAKNPEEAIRVMQNVVKEIPSGLHNMFFKAFPVAIAIQDTWVSNDKFSTFITDIAAINPLYGFIILFREGWNLKGATITHPGYLMAASVAGGFTVVELASIIAKGGDRTANLIRFALSPAYTVRDTLGMATRAAQNTYRFVNASAYLQAEGRMEVAKMASAVGRNKLRSWLTTAGILAATLIPMAAVSYAERKNMNDTLAVAEKKGMLDPETGLVLSGITKTWHEWTADQKQSLVRMSSMQLLGEHVADCAYDAKNGKVTAMIDAPKEIPQNGVIGITSAAQIEAWKTTVKQFGLTPEIAYTRNADAYLNNQFNGLAATWVPNGELIKFQKEIDWYVEKA